MRRVLFSPLAAALLAGAAAATVVVRLDLQGLTSRSEAILEGKCLSTRPVLDGAGNIATAVRVAVSRAFKGAAVGEVEFRLPGGEMGDRGLLIPGMPGFSAGEELLLFLTPESPTGIRLPVGLGQGKFRVERDPATGRKALARSLGGVRLLDPATGEALPGPGEERFEYDALAALVERLVREGR
ncbi:MAG TPA: hypothetical protein VFI25_03665 [Planctomycetota bacterium]|jgi:hypothetical protein|nr:hypothetical protein [Planctomycetota bacterium]